MTTPVSFAPNVSARSVTAATTVAANELVVVDATNAALTITGPAAGSSQTWGVKKSDSSTNAVTISYVNAAGATTTITLPVQDDAKWFRPQGSGYVATSADRSRTVDDQRYGPKQYGYLMAGFRGQTTAQQALSIYTSGDGVSFSDLQGNPVWTPSDGSVVRDPSILWSNGYLYAAYTRTPATGTSFDVVRTSDFVTWTKVATVDCSTIGGVTGTWAPQLRTDETGTIYAFVAINATSMYWLRATAADLSTWTAPTALVITGAPAQVIDADFIKRGQTWYCFAKDETSGGKVIIRATATTITGPYTVDKSGDWAGWGTGVEGPCVIQKHDGTYRIYMDRYAASTGIAYSDSTDLTTWGPLTGISISPALGNGDLARHGDVLPITDARAAAAIASYVGRRPQRFAGYVPVTQVVPAGFYVGQNGGSPQAVWSDGTNAWSWDIDTVTGNFRLMRTSVGAGITFNYTGGLITATFTARSAFTATTPNTQGATAGAYIGKTGSAVGVDLADGTNTIRFENDGTGLFRILRAGIQSNFEVDMNGNTKMHGGAGFFNTAPPTTKPTVTGSRGGNAALASLLTTLAATGLFTDGTTA